MSGPLAYARGSVRACMSGPLAHARGSVCARMSGPLAYARGSVRACMSGPLAYARGSVRACMSGPLAYARGSVRVCVSGPLAYALGSVRVCVSGPLAYALGSVLSRDREGAVHASGGRSLAARTRKRRPGWHPAGPGTGGTLNRSAGFQPAPLHRGASGTWVRGAVPRLTIATPATISTIPAQRFSGICSARKTWPTSANRT